ncbi:MAG: diadenylate cyclase, partial [bacterium]
LKWETLLTIFHPRTPLHDGAVIISGETILAARCILPLADVSEDEAYLGMRHRAALGITHESDAVAVVISEETGKISVAVDGRFVGKDLDEEHLNHILNSLLGAGRIEEQRLARFRGRKGAKI